MSSRAIVLGEARSFDCASLFALGRGVCHMRAWGSKFRAQAVWVHCCRSLEVRLRYFEQPEKGLGFRNYGLAVKV